MKIKRSLLLGFSLFVGLFFVASSHPKNASAAARISISHSTVNLTEGESQVITITLDEPIIAPGPDDGYVDIDIDVDGSDRISLDTEAVSIPASEWFQPHTFIVTAIDDGIDNGDETASVITLSAVSNSEYYSGFNAANVSVNVTDNDDTPAVADTSNSTSQDNEQSNTTTVAVLANTGQDVQSVTYLAYSLLVVGLAYRFLHYVLYKRGRYNKAKR